MFILGIVCFLYLCVTEGSSSTKAVAWTIIGIFAFIYMLADAGVDSDGLGAAFWVLVLIAIVVGIAVLISKLTSGNENPHPASSQAPSHPRQKEPAASEPKRSSVNTVCAQPPIAMDEKRTHANVICYTSPSTQLQMEKNQIDHDLAALEKRMNEFLEKYGTR